MLTVYSSSNNLVIFPIAIVVAIREFTQTEEIVP